MYEYIALSIGFGQIISQPYTIAFMMELLQPESRNEVLDVGFGSGWITGILAKALGKQGAVCVVEIVPEVYKFGKGNLQKLNYPNIEFYKESWEDSPTRKFDCILVSAAAASVPDKLVAKLKIDGRMVIPVKTGFDHTIRLVKKISESKVIEQNYPGFVFVPLI